ncbi:MAG TPA: glycosyltransferase family 87 protein [Candidatus Acidoferrum sp.]|nr:glycosyltransferase family 87 protein [Candidatus Acidoferrum sp.]
MTNTMRAVSRVPPKPAQISTGSSAKALAFDGILAYLGLAVLLVSAVFWADHPPGMEKTDFSVTYIGSRMVYLGQGAQLYDLAAQRRLKAALLKDAEPLIYEHPPFEALLLAPLGALPYKTAYLLWGLINVAIWLSLPRLLRAYATAPRDELGYLALWVLFAPLGVALYQGQSSIVLLLVYILAFISLKQGRDFRAGAILGLGLFKFQFILPFVLIFLLRRQWRFLKGFLATAAGLGVLSVVAVGWSGVWSYVNLLRSIAGHPDNSTFGAAIGMGTVQGFVHAVLGRVLPAPAISVLVAVISLGLIGWIAWRWPEAASGRGSDLRSFDLMFAAAVVVALVTGFHMFTHDLSPLLLAMLLVAAHFPGRGRLALRLALGVPLVLFWIPFLYFALLAWHCVYLWFPVLMVFMMGALRVAKMPASGIPGSGIPA